MTAAGSDGDRFVTCSKGHEHWGEHGAAGLLLRHRDGEGPVRYLLQKRSGDVDHAGQWSIPSGAKGKGESPEQGAEREFREEMGRLPQGSKHSHTVQSTNCGDWQFHTAVYDAPSTAMPKGTGETEHEVAGSGWFTPHEIKGLPLHPAFAKSWDQVRRSRGPVTAAAMETGGVDDWLDVPTPVGDDEDHPKETTASLDVEAASDRTVCIVLDVPPGLIHNVDESVEYEPHVTVAYLGKDLDDDGFAEVLRRAENAASSMPGPLTGTLSGLDTFPASKSSDGKVPAYIPANMPGIHVLRKRLEDLSVSEHSGYVPHVTMGYFDPGDKLPSPHHAVPITFTHLTVRRGEHEQHRFPFGG